MKKFLSSSIIIVIAIIVWLNIKDKADVIQPENFSVAKKNEKIDLSKELALVGAPVQDALKTSLSLTPISSSGALTKKESSSPPLSSSLSSSLSHALPIDALDFKIDNINQSVKLAMEKYLRDSSNLKFPDNTDVSLALFEARDGNPLKINNIVKSFKEKIPRLEAISPPAELKEFHDKSLISIKSYAASLEKIAQAAGNKEKILEILNSPEINSARNTAREILTNLRAIVQKYNLSISAEVLPKDKIPSQKP